MKVKCLSFLLLAGCIFVTTSKAQQSEPALARVIYDFTHINDTLQPDKPHKEEMVLYIGQRTSLYGTYASERVNQQVKAQMEDPAFDGNLTITGSGRTTQESYYSNVAEQQFKLLSRVAGEQYVVDEDYPAIDWQIAEDTREIGGYMAQKATGHFKGRDYTAWFTTDVPFHAGPWKLQGLPGLVLEATDSRSEVAFGYAGFETLEDGAAMVAIAENAIPTDKKALDKLTEAYRKNPQAAMNARARTESGGTNVVGYSGTPRATVSVGTGGGAGGAAALDASRIKSINVKRDDSQTSSVTNNPLELTEK
ncbi:GLPGLI family protein [Parapedobacter koreensis]|uniref:GLPGLI family protein n=1 Tax=Parapedobacter koreensis TaxID=332977 RepID=A0A1H7QRX0_9SPHI|nr:GLPGLI family protein [Parapedobacter koreensis]SEL50662.1 GLPGLI family protein [Parapedobacter koreensis]